MTGKLCCATSAEDVYRVGQLRPARPSNFRCLRQLAPACLFLLLNGNLAFLVLCPYRERSPYRQDHHDSG